MKDASLGALHHLALGANNVETLAQFYSRAFELSECARHLYDDGSLRSIWLGLKSGGVLMIEHVLGGSTDPEMTGGSVSNLRPLKKVEPGFFLLCFSVEKEMRAERETLLLELGAERYDSTGFTSYFFDPEGNRVAISCYPLP